MLDKEVRARLVKMVAVAVFATASHSTVALLSGSNSETANIAPDRRPGLWITTGANVGRIAAGESVTLNIKVVPGPDGTGAARDVGITDALPPEVDLVGRPVCTGGSGDVAAQCTYDSSSRTIIARWGDLSDARIAAQVSFVVRANSSLRCRQKLENLAVLEWSDSPGGSPQRAESSVVLLGPGPGDKDCPRYLPGTSLLAAESRALGASRAGSDYPDLGMSLDIPRLGIYRLAIVGVPLVGETWDIGGLADNAGWLEMTAMPGEKGNSVVTAHVTDAYGRDGPFAQLSTLVAGEQIVVHAAGQLYTYQVQWANEVAPDDLSVLDDPGASHLRVLTLVTCSRPNYTTHTYDARLVVQAVMIDQIPQE